MISELGDLRPWRDRAGGWEFPVCRRDDGGIAHAERLPGGRIRRGPRSSEWSRLRPVWGRAAGART